MSGAYAIVAFLVAYVVSHLTKFTIYLVQSGFKGPREVFVRAFSSGGMPSAHTAEMVAMTMYLGLAEGFGSSCPSCARFCSGWLGGSRFGGRGFFCCRAGFFRLCGGFVRGTGGGTIFLGH